ncbi:N-acetylmuramidase domain-containing protein [Nitratireductor kimnyeongensis]|nr:N-acetylmuramidase domain-containing protein [Nitratireductor kimnyeongensis]
MLRGREEPIIRFEGHYFDRRLADAKRWEARAAGLSSPEVGKIANPRGQVERWLMFEQAARIDRKAACESVSWGVGQVMGAHWSWLGFADVEALVAEARCGIAGQVGLMLRYIGKAGLKDALMSRDWVRFARGYNGPGYRRNQYDRKLARAYRAYSAGGGPPVTEAVLRIGTRGAAVESLQVLLCALGQRVAVDGVFGPQTDLAVQRIQKEAGLISDGVVGPVTREALTRRLPYRALGLRLWAYFLRLRGFLEAVF